MLNDGKSRFKKKQIRKCLLKKILVTGAKGFTGINLIKSLQDKYIIHSLNSDLRNLESLIDELNDLKFDFVIHLAGLSHVDYFNSLDIYHVNVIGTENLLKTLVKNKHKSQIKKILIASSANVYGNCNNSPIEEHETTKPISHYGISKLSMEQIATNYLYELPLFITRPFNYIGEGQSENFIIPKIVKHFVRKMDCIELGNINVQREFNDIRFLIDAYHQLLYKSDPGEIYNVCTGRVYSLKKIISLLEKMTSHSIEIKVNPSFIRKGEIKILCGSSKKLKSIIGDTDFYSIEDSLLKIIQTM